MNTVQMSGGIELKPFIKGSWAQALREYLAIYGKDSIPSASAYSRYQELNGYDVIMAEYNSRLLKEALKDGAFSYARNN